MATFGERFHNLRVEHGYTMESLAAILNKKYGTRFNKSMFSKWEKDINSPEIRVMPILSNFFGVSVDYLIGVTDEGYDEDERYVVMFRGALKSVDKDKKKMLIDGVDNMYKMLGHDPEKYET